MDLKSKNPMDSGFQRNQVVVPNRYRKEFGPNIRLQVSGRRHFFLFYSAPVRFLSRVLE